jgi:hypothetical protein
VKSPVSPFVAGLFPSPAFAAALGLGLFVTLIPGALLADSEPPKIEVGRSALVVNHVVGKFGAAEPAPIKLDDQVLFNEDISTGKAAKTVVQFRDGSTFAMGPDAVAKIDSFIFNPDESVSKKTVTVTQGVFRYISGFSAKDQNTEIKIINGTMSIRGSVVSGVVTPGAPPMLFVAQGAATFSNDAGSTSVLPGQAIAVPSPTTAPINPASLPPAVVAQVLQVIEPLLPAPQVQSSLTQTNPQVLSQQGKLNLVPAAAQQTQQAAAPAGPPALRPSTGPGTASLARSMPLLNQANAVGLLNGSQTSPTPQQQAFLNQVGQAAPQAQAQITQVLNTATAAHDTAAATATVAVAQGLSAAGPTQTAALTPPPGPAAGPPATGAPLATPGTAAVTPNIIPTSVQAVQSAIASPGVNVTPTVLSVSESNPAVSEAALRTALNVLGAGTGAAAAMITSFAEDAGNVADCDLTAGQQMAAALQAVLKDPGFSALATNAPQAVALAQATASSIGVTTFGPTGTPTAATGASTLTPLTTAAGSTTSPTDAAPPSTTTATPAPTFGNFGSIVGTGASTSPAS